MMLIINIITYLYYYLVSTKQQRKSHSSGMIQVSITVQPPQSQQESKATASTTSIVSGHLHRRHHHHHHYYCRFYRYGDFRCLNFTYSILVLFLLLLLVLILILFYPNYHLRPSITSIISLPVVRYCHAFSSLSVSRLSQRQQYLSLISSPNKPIPTTTAQTSWKVWWSRYLPNNGNTKRTPRTFLQQQLRQSSDDPASSSISGSSIDKIYGDVCNTTTATARNVPFKYHHLTNVERIFCLSDLHTDHIDNLHWLQNHATATMMTTTDL